MTLDFIISPTYDLKLFNIVDISAYDVTYPSTFIPILTVSIPNGFDKALVSFQTGTYNILNSNILGITTEDPEDLPDGVYVFNYSVNAVDYVEKTFMRVDKLMQKYDEAFVRLDMVQCDQTVKKQEKVQLDTVFGLIQGAVALANNCAVGQAQELYNKADKMLSRFNSKSVCCGTYLN